VGEEIGWTGYAIDPMQKRWSSLKAATVLVLVTMIGHYQSMIMQGRGLKWNMVYFRHHYFAGRDGLAL